MWSLTPLASGVTVRSEAVLLWLLKLPLVLEADWPLLGPEADALEESRPLVGPTLLASAADLPE